MKTRRLATLGLALGLTLTAVPATGATASAATCPAGVAAAMTDVNDHWLARHPAPKALDWTIGAYFTGDMAAASAVPDQHYLDYARTWAATAKFALAHGPKDTDANDQAAGQTYLELYQADPEHPAADIAQISASARSMVHSSKVDDWWWIDALYMAMPAFAKLGVVEKDPSYWDKMYAEFHSTKQTQGLWNAGKGLWWRDKNFVGQNVYWARGNGWVIAALARVLDVLPATDPHRAEYVQTFRQMAAALKAAQRPNGFWTASLTDPGRYPGPETSGTAFFTFALAWGVDHGILDSATYAPIVAKAWNAMATTAVQADGSLGYVQGPGDSPSSAQPVTAKSTASYGVGAFLLAGSELTRMCSGSA